MNRGILITMNDDGSERRQAVGERQSVLNLESDLIKHLSEQPFSDEWLRQLRDYCDARLEARRGARASGGFIFPQGVAFKQAGVQ